MPIAPIRVARLPNIISVTTHPVRILDIRHPIKTPGIAYGVKTGSIVRASENLTCIAPFASPSAFVIYVRTTYIVAMIAPVAMPRTFFLLFKFITPEFCFV